MTKHLTEKEVFVMASKKLNNTKVNAYNLHKMAYMLDLEYDLEKGMYLNPDYTEL